MANPPAMSLWAPWEIFSNTLSTVCCGNEAWSNHGGMVGQRRSRWPTIQPWSGECVTPDNQHGVLLALQAGVWLQGKKSARLSGQQTTYTTLVLYDWFDAGYAPHSSLTANRYHFSPKSDRCHHCSKGHWQTDTGMIKNSVQNLLCLPFSTLCSF